MSAATLDGRPTDAGEGEAARDAGPVIRILGDATEEEVAALVSVLAAASGPGGSGDDADGRSRERSSWGTRQRLLRRSSLPPAGPGGWRASSRPVR